jgi:heterodisulfide reductase subunit B
MKTYAYFPGCSLEKMAESYHRSSLLCARELGVELKELEDWNCCGATAYFHIDELLAYTLCARNLAMAEKDQLDVVAPCSGCFKNMYFANAHLQHDPDLAEHINWALEEDQLQYQGKVKVRHLLEVFAEDVGPDAIRQKVKQPLTGLRVAGYYGCQLIRPRKANEDVEEVSFFEELLAATGADPVPYAPKLRCCGGSLIVTSRKAALDMVAIILQGAVDRDAHVIATICPLCQTNLECYQQEVNRQLGTHYEIPVVYFTQLLGLSLGIPAKQLGLGKELVSIAPLSRAGAAAASGA